MFFARIAFLLLAILTAPAMAQPSGSDLPQLGPRAAPTAHVQVGSLPSMDSTPAFNSVQATDKYLSRISGAVREIGRAHV